MGFVKEIKKKMAEALAERFRGNSSFVLVDYSSLSGRQATELRRALRSDGIRMAVVKNSVARFAFQAAGMAEAGETVEGMNAVVYGDDPVAIAKKIHEFIRTHQILKVRRGYIDGKTVAAEEIRALSQLPSIKEIQGSLVGTIQAPVAQFVRTLHEIPGTFVRTLEEIRKKKEGEGP